MKQLLLRVPDDVHRRLADRAAGSGRSINSLATTILDAAISGEPGGRQARLKARAAARNLLTGHEIASARQTAQARAAALESTRGLGEVLDAILDEDRARG